jgi:uncharacterized lipoprotein YajG
MTKKFIFLAVALISLGGCTTNQYQSSVNATNQTINTTNQLINTANQLVYTVDRLKNIISN